MITNELYILSRKRKEHLIFTLELNSFCKIKMSFEFMKSDLDSIIFLILCYLRDTFYTIRLEFIKKTNLYHNC